MEIFKEFGVNPVLLVAQIFNFLLILFVLKRFAYKPVLELIEKRKKEIEKSVRDNELAKETLDKAQEKERQILLRAQEKSDKILSDAKTEATELRNKAEDAAKSDSERIIEQARAQIQDETRVAEERLSNKIGTIAISLLEKSLQGIFSQKEQQTILKRADEAIKRTSKI